MSIISLQWLLLKLQLLSTTTRSLISTSWFIKPWGIIGLNQFPIQSVSPGILLHDLCNIANATPCHITQKGGGWGNVKGASWMQSSGDGIFLCELPLLQSNGEKLEAQALFIYLTKLHLLLKAWKTLRRCKEPSEGDRMQVEFNQMILRKSIRDIIWVTWILVNLKTFELWNE